MYPFGSFKIQVIDRECQFNSCFRKFDIVYATSILARYLTLPRKGQYEAAPKIFSYLRKFSYGKILIDINQPLARNMLKVDMSKLGLNYI